jgi:hypothetical protein
VVEVDDERAGASGYHDLVLLHLNLKVGGEPDGSASTGAAAGGLKTSVTGA